MNHSNLESPDKSNKSEEVEDDYGHQCKSNFEREKDILIELERYSKSLQAEMLNVISVEKEKEDEWEALYEKISDEEEKKKIEMQIRLERSESSIRILNMKQ